MLAWANLIKRFVLNIMNAKIKLKKEFSKSYVEDIEKDLDK